MPVSEDNRITLIKLLRFTKIEHTIFSFPFLFAGAWLGAGRALPSWKTLVFVFIAGVGARVMGISMNRILDHKIDSNNPRTANRELPSGQITIQGAYGVALVGLVIYLVSCFQLSRLCLLLSPIPAVFLISYSLLKRYTYLCHFGIGFCLLMAPVGAYIATSNTLPKETDILLLTLFTFCWMSGFDIIYALQDIDFDREAGVYSIPAAIGSTNALIVAALVHGAALLAAVGLLLLSGGSVFAGFAFSVSAAAFVLAYVPQIPLAVRFFPLSAIAGIAGAIIPLMWVG